MFTVETAPAGEVRLFHRLGTWAAIATLTGLVFNPFALISASGVVLGILALHRAGIAAAAGHAVSDRGVVVLGVVVASLATVIVAVSVFGS